MKKLVLLLAAVLLATVEAQHADHLAGHVARTHYDGGNPTSAAPSPAGNTSGGIGASTPAT